MLEGELRGTGAGLAVEPTASQDVSGAGDWQGREPRQASAPRLAGPSASVGPSLGATQRAVGTAPRENRAGPHPLDSRPQPVFQQEEFVSKP